LATGISGTDGPEGLEFIVDISAMVVTDEMRRLVDAEFGAGVVKREGRLQPIG
jgi:hypothetical protein